MKTPSAWSICLFLGLTAAAAAQASDRNLNDTYQEAAGRIIGEALSSTHAYDRLGYLCDTFGHRLSGSTSLENAIVWAQQEMRRDGLSNVRGEPVMVPAWVRGREHIHVLAPVGRELNMLGLGNSIGTSPEGITAEVVVVKNFDEMNALGEDRIRGRIVLFNTPFEGYSKTVVHRTQGASKAAALGAVAVMVRSIGPGSLDTPHTGMLSYAADAPQIPAAAVTVEDAEFLQRCANRGQRIQVNFRMDAYFEDDKQSANVVAEIPGVELPHEVVVVAGHFDSWDVGDGAQDDGAGCIIAWEAARLIHKLNLRPKRTIRVVLYTNEENGLRGAAQYVQDHAQAVPHHVAALESDAGNGLARGFRLDVRAAHDPNADEEEKRVAKEAAARTRRHAENLLRDICRLLAPLNMDGLRVGGAGADIGSLMKAGVVGLGLDHDTAEYWKIHHTPADTFDKIVIEDLNRNIAAMAVMAYVLADMPERLDDSFRAAADQN